MFIWKERYRLNFQQKKIRTVVFFCSVHCIACWTNHEPTTTHHRKEKSGVYRIDDDDATCNYATPRQRSAPPPAAASSPANCSSTWRSPAGREARPLILLSVLVFFLVCSTLPGSIVLLVGMWACLPAVLVYEYTLRGVWKGETLTPHF